jgi:hypothetical protein
VSRTPALCVLPKAQLDIQQCSSWAAEQLARTGEQLLGGSSSSSSSTQAGSGTAGAVQQEGQQQRTVVCCDQGYLHLLPQLQEAMLMAYQVDTPNRHCICTCLFAYVCVLLVVMINMMQGWSWPPVVQYFQRCPCAHGLAAVADQ